tara:strand:+ start:6303 stop:7535 length:1233 start_codon:yes stop_codon:yes gene_type:complete
MAIDPRISLAASTQDVITPALNMFENTLNARSNRAAQQQNITQSQQNIAQSQQQMNQLDIMNPLLAQEGQQNIDINKQTIATTRDESRFKNIFQTSQMLKPFIANNDAAGAEQFMLKNISRLQDAQARGEDVDLTESLETLEQVKAGNLQGVAQNITAIEGIAQQRMNKAMSAGQREFNQLAVLAGGDKNLDITQAARIKLGLVPRASTSTELKILEDPEGLGKAQVKQAGNVSTVTEQSKVDVQIPAEEQKQTLTANISRLKVLKEGEKASQATIRKAKRFKKAFTSGTESGATRSAWSIVPGVFTDQAGFDEQFNAFAEVAARQTLKASGETKPTDNDVEGMKRAMFGVGRDEATNIKLLEDYISSQEDVLDELDDLRESKKAGTLKTFVGKKAELSEADIFANYGIK